MTLHQTIALWAIFSAGALFILLWTLGYLIMVGVIIGAWSSGRLPWRRAIWAIVVMIVIWPVILGGALSKAKRPDSERPRAEAPPHNARGPA